jgi:sulfate adenylyltransferase subunit 1
MNVLKFTTAGSVDDGKSTLIGRFLYDTKSLTTDQIEAIEKASRRKGNHELDLSLATDGLIAEREQGITIDVAHIYFSTLKRKFIIADTPGHVEYTRNMITGASSSQAALILIDARNGMLEQTKRHLYITNLLRIKEVIVCINKMDLVGFDEKIYYSISADLKKYAEGLFHNDFSLHFFPISAKLGDNVVSTSSNMPWYHGEPLLSFLENLKIEEDDSLPARFAVQYVVRTDNDKMRDYRAFAGKMKSGVFKVGDEVMAFPSARTSTIKSIDRFEESLQSVGAGESVAISLTDEIDISRGCLLVKKDEIPQSLREMNATICWMSTDKMNPAARYTLQHGITRTPAKIDFVKSILDPGTLQNTDRIEVVLNDIADVSIRTANQVYADNYEKNHSNGSFIIIDNQTNNTVAVGFVR